MDNFAETVLIPEYTRGRRRAASPAYQKVQKAIARARGAGDRAALRLLRKQQRSLLLAATLSAHDSAWLGVDDPACLGEQLAWGQRPAGTDAWRVTAHALALRERPGIATAGR